MNSSNTLALCFEDMVESTSYIFLEMGIKIAHIHGIAKKWMPGIDIAEKIQKLSRDKIAQNPDLSVRSWVREVVVMLENLRSQSIN